jgi:hypothetical protein
VKLLVILTLLTGFTSCSNYNRALADKLVKQAIDTCKCKFNSRVESLEIYLNRFSEEKGLIVVCESGDTFKVSNLKVYREPICK